MLSGAIATGLVALISTLGLVAVALIKRRSDTETASDARGREQVERDEARVRLQDEREARLYNDAINRTESVQKQLDAMYVALDALRADLDGHYAARRAAEQALAVLQQEHEVLKHDVTELRAELAERDRVIARLQDGQ